jgi:hypothetical protein
MSQSQVLQCARFNSSNIESNATWTTQLAEQVTINQGDSLVVRQCFLDSRLNQSGNIVIPIDTELSLTYYFYMMFQCDGASTATINSPDATTTNNSKVDINPTDYRIFGGIYQTTGIQNSLTQYQGVITQDATGIPEKPYPPTPNQFYAVNQSMAIEVPHLLVSWKTGANNPSPNDAIPYTRTWKYTLPAGSYSPDNLAEILTKAMTSIESDEDREPSINPFQQFGTSSVLSPYNNFLTRGTQIALTPSPSGNLVTPYTSDGLVQDRGFNYSSNTTNPPTQTNCVFANFLTDCTLDGRYLTNLVDYDGASLINNPFIFTPAKYQAQYLLDGLVEGASTQSAVMYTTPLIGASDISLQFNDQGNVFELITHTPIQELPQSGSAAAAQSSEPIDVVKIIKTINVAVNDASYLIEPIGEVKICQQTRHSGIIFQSMSPISFWRDTLGFDVENLTFSPSEIFGANKIMDFNTFNKVTSQAFVGIDNNFDLNPKSATTDNLNQPAYISAYPLTLAKGQTAGNLTYTNLMNSARWFIEEFLFQNPLQFEIANPYFPYDNFFGKTYYEEYSSEVQSVNTIQAINPPLSQISNTGHYLISISSYKNSTKDFINEQSIFNVKAIISSYYVSAGSFISSQLPDFFQVEHIGETITLNNFRISILDPITMEEATDLGPNSSIYLQLNKSLNKVSLLQPE